MTRVFVDTSAIVALLVPTDAAHSAAKTIFGRLQGRESTLITTSYNLVETYALLDRRFGRDAVVSFREGFAPLLEVVWVDRALHDRALDLLLDHPHGVSLVDAVSFVAIDDYLIDEVFAFDQHFNRQGLPVLR